MRGQSSNFARHTLLCALLSATGCGDFFKNQTSSLGGDTAGERGTVRVLFINNTDHRAVFTFGTYDQVDRFSTPDFDQFGLRDSDPNLDGDTESDFLVPDCARVFSIGSPRLLELMETNLDGEEFIDEALVEGVEFFQTPDADDDSAPQSQGFAPPLEALLGVDFPCGALLILYFEIADTGDDPFRIDFELVPPDSAP